MIIKVNYTVSDVYMSTSISPVYIKVVYSGTSGGGGGTWGTITGTLSDQTDLQDALDDKVPYTGATANVNLGEFQLAAGQVSFDQTPTGTAGVGVMRWNDSDGTVDLGLKGGNVTLQVGQEQVQRVVNKSGSNLLEANYQVVKVTSAQGQRLAVDLAQGDSDANSTDTIGIVTETINNNQEGFITTSGLVREINTSGSLQGETWNDGDVLYLSPTIAGQITNIKPTAPNHTVTLGYVVYSHAVHGKIFVKPDNGYEIQELHNVYAPSPNNNEGIFWNSANLRYQNNTIAGVLGFTPVTNARTIATTSPLVGGGDLTADRTLSIPAATTSVNGYLTSTDWNTFNSKVPSTRNITINGTSYDLSADRSWTIAAGITGSGVANQLTYWNGTNSVTGSTGLVYNDSLGEITLNKNQNANTALIINNVNTGTAATALISFNSGKALLVQYGSNYAGYRAAVANDFAIYKSTSGDILLQHDQVNGKIKFAAGQSSIAQMTLTASGRLLLGTTTESTYIFDAVGTARVSDTFTAGTNTFTNKLNAQFGTFGIQSYAVNNGFMSDNMYFNGSSWTRITTGYGMGFQFAGGQVFFHGIGNGTGIFTQNLKFKFDYEGAFVIGNNLSPTVTDYTGATALFTKNGRLLLGTTTENTSALVNITSTTQGFLPPRMTTTQRDAISSPATGLVIYNTTLNSTDTYDGARWRTDSETITTNRQTASYSLVLADRGKLIEMNLASANTLTVPLNSSIAFPIGTKIDVTQYGAGATTITATGGVTIRSFTSYLKLAGQYAACTLVKIGTDEWYCYGNLIA